MAKPLPDADRMDLLTRVRQFIQASGAQYEEVLLFGSVVNGPFTEYSDIDLLVIVESEEEISDARSQLSGLSTFLKWPVDLIVCSRQHFEERAQVGGLFALVKANGERFLKLP